MNSVLQSQQPLAPHMLNSSRHSPHRIVASHAVPTPQPRKRKAEDDGHDLDVRMFSPTTTTSPSSSSHPTCWSVLSKTTKKKKKTQDEGELNLSRLLRTLEPDQLRTIIQQICVKYPEVHAEVIENAPRPSIETVLSILQDYENSFKAAFPYGGRLSSEYTYNRVESSLFEFLDAIKDFTPPLMPPNQAQPLVSLRYLDKVTAMVEQIPDWDSYQNNRPKQETYESLSHAWTQTIREVGKKGAGFQLHHGGWDKKLARHNEKSGNRLSEPVAEMDTYLAWLSGRTSTIDGHGSAKI